MSAGGRGGAPRGASAGWRERARGVRVVCFDVDGTLVHSANDKTVWQLMNERYLKGDAVDGRRFAAFREGHITYPEWVALDVGEWHERGIGRADIEDTIRGALRPAPGALRTIAELRRRGYFVGVISGTINATLEIVLEGARFDRVFSNRIFFDEGGAICGWQATPFDVRGKAEALGVVAREVGVPLSECAFVGDAWNDLAALGRAGFGVAYRPKCDEVREAADLVLEEGSLEALLEVFEGAP